MTKNLILTFLPALSLATGCVIVSDNGTDGSGGTGSTGGTSSTSSTSGGSGATAGSTGTTTGSGSDTGTAGSDTGTAGGTTGGAGGCGWGPTGIPDPAEGYVCGGNGEDPNGTFPMACPDGLTESGPCGDVTGVGCCDAASGAVWYCSDTGILVTEDCA